MKTSRILPLLALLVGLAIPAKAVPYIFFEQNEVIDGKLWLTWVVKESETDEYVLGLNFYYNNFYAGFGDGVGFAGLPLSPLPHYLNYGTNELTAVVASTGQFIGPGYLEIAPVAESTATVALLATALGVCGVIHRRRSIKGSQQ